MRMTLQEMRIANFKGIRSLTVTFGSASTAISGMNGTGKSSIADAFSWVLWNKDSHGNAPGSDNFHEKPLDEHGNEIHNLDTTVELLCTLDGQRFDLKRTQRENWVKKRGAAAPTLQGNVSTYWINGVETKLQDFRQRIASISSEDVFKLIGSLSAFNRLEWKKRREQLLAIAGGNVDAGLLAKPEYQPLAAEISARNVTVDDLRKVLADQRKRVNEELKTLPVRIDEARASMQMPGAREVSDSEYLVAENRKDIERIDGYIAEEKVHAGGAELRAQLLSAESELVSLKRRMTDELIIRRSTADGEANAQSDAFRRLSAMLADARRHAAATEKRIAEKTDERDALRQKFLAVRAEQFQTADGGLCPTCGQPLPEAMIEAARAQFDADRKARLAKIQADGKSVSAEIEALQSSASDAKRETEELAERAEAARQARDAAFERAKEIPREPDWAADERFRELTERIAQLKAEQAQSPDAHIRDLEERRRELQGKLEKHLAVLARRDAAAETEKRIAAHEKRQQELGAQLCEIESKLALAERFVQERCTALEENINGKFPTVRWKLFDRQINGGIIDTCVCMIPCESGLVSYECANTAAQVNADIEIVNVLSKAYDLSVPLFVDNSERVNQLADTDSQLITLSVSNDQQLKIMEG